MARTKEAAGTRGGYHHGNLRAALIEAAQAILEEDGLAGLSLRGAARRAGVSQTAPYRHFADKDGLLAAVAAEGFRLLRASLLGAAEGAADESERRRRLAHGYVRFATQHKALFGLMFGAELRGSFSDPELARAADEAHAVIAGAMAERVPGGAADPAARSAALAAWSLVHGLAMLVNEGVVSPDEPGEAGLDALVDRVARHLRAQP